MTAFSQGEIWNDEAQQGLIESFSATEITRSKTPSNYSLEQYIYHTYDQGNTYMCAAYALSSARGILYASHSDASDDLKKKENNFSPFFLYVNNVSSNTQNVCLKEGLFSYKVIMFMIKEGLYVFSKNSIYGFRF